MTLKRGRFLSFEGIEGCGKTTQIALLSDYLKKNAVPHTITREPGGTAVGEGIRNFKSAMKEGDNDPEKKA